MFRRLRQSRISLAAKCQLLFGTAVAIIIFAALFVPFQRMEQLTEQLNEKAAAAVCDAAVNEHVARETEFAADTVARLNGSLVVTDLAIAQATSRPSEVRAHWPTTLPSETAIAEGLKFPPPRIVPVAALQRPEMLTKFEAAAMIHFTKEPRKRFEQRYYDTDEGARGYRYAQPLYAGNRCIACHSNGVTSVVAEVSAAELSDQSRSKISATQPTTLPTLLGIASVDLPSQIRANEVLLNRVFLLVAGLIAGTLAIIIFYLITTRLILQPVRVLQETAQRVSDGDLNIRSDINTGDEFQQLSETFNTMLFNLKQSSDMLRAVNKNLDLKLGQLAETNVALYESNRLKSEFLANVSHELRTPLNSILGFADLLKDQMQPAGAPDSKVSRYLQNIIGSGSNLLELINDLLDLAKIEAGRVDVRALPLSLPDMLEALASLLRPLAEKKQLTFSVTVASDVPIVQTDPAKLQQVLYNLLSNAIKFSPPGERIAMSAERCVEGDSVRISVTDRGPGIERDQQKMIFEKFRQLDASATREHGGTGLGLAISKELAALLGGKLDVVSAPGEGATFSVTIPRLIESSTHDVRGKLQLS